VQVPAGGTVFLSKFCDLYAFCPAFEDVHVNPNPCGTLECQGFDYKEDSSSVHPVGKLQVG